MNFPVNNETVPKKKTRGRPVKNKDVIIERMSPDMNINKRDIIPASSIQTILQYKEPSKKYMLVIANKNPKTWEQLFGILKDNGLTYIDITFDKSGITIDNSQEDMARICIRLLIGEMIDYRLKEKIIVRIETEKIHKVFKNIKSKSLFYIYLENDLKDLFILVPSINSRKDSKYAIKLQTNTDIEFYDINVNNESYDLIFMIESEHFHTLCKNMNAFKVTHFTMCCNNSETSINWSSDKIECLNTIREGKNQLVFCKKMVDNNDIVQNKYKLNTFFKYTKSHKFSKILKIYLSSDNKYPAILEYDIDPHFGIFQIFVEPDEQ